MADDPTNASPAFLGFVCHLSSHFAVRAVIENHKTTGSGRKCLNEEVPLA
jgi:hypothetical protein